MLLLLYIDSLWAIFIMKFESGKIIKARTTFVEFISNGVLYRVDYQNKFFSTKVSGDFDEGFITDSHPILKLFENNWIQITFNGGAFKGNEFVEKIKGFINNYFQNYNITKLQNALEMYNYFVLDNLNDKSYGLLLQGPKSMVSGLIPIFEEYSLAYKMHDKFRDFNKLKILCLDTNYIIANEFIITPQNGHE